MKRLQLRHHDELFTSRELALKFFSDILNPENVKNGKFGTSLYAEPMVVKYTDSDGKTQILFAIGTDTPNAPYHIIDSAELSERIDNEIARAIAAEAILQNNIDAEVARAKDAESVLDKKINDEVLRATAEEIRLQGVIDAEIARAKDAESVLDKKIDDNLTSIVSIEPSSANVLEEYALKNNKNELLGEHIKIYKDSSLVGAVNGFKGAKMVEKMDDGSFVLTYDEALRDESVEYLYLVYRNEEGNLKLVGIDFENFLMEAEFGDGMKVVDHVASIKIKDGEKYLETSKDGLYTINIDEAINDSVNEEKLRAEAEEARLQGAIDAEVARAMDAESVLDKKVNDEIVRATAEETRLQGVIDAEIARAKDAESVLDKKVNDEITRATGEEAKINAEVKANKINSKDVVLNVTENGTNLTIQTDEVTITKKANASTIYDTNIAVLGSLLSVKKVAPTNTSIKSRYELQGADGKQIGDAIELPVESALVDVRQGRLGASIDITTGIYTEGTGDVTMDFIYRLEDGNYKLLQILVSEYFTDSHFGRGLNNQDGTVSLLEGDGNEFLVIGEDTIAVVGVNAAINEAKQSAIETVEAKAKEYTDTKVSDLSLYVDTFVSTSVNNAVETLNNTINSNVETLNQTIASNVETLSQSIVSNVETLSQTIDTNVETLNNTINTVVETFNNAIEVESERAIAAENALSERIYNEENLRISADKEINARIDKEIADRIAADEVLRDVITSTNEETIENTKVIVAEEIAKIVANAPEKFDTLKEIADWIETDITGSAQMANDITELKGKVETLENKVAELEDKVAEFENKIAELESKPHLSSDDIKDIIKNYLAGVENEVKLESNADNSKLTIGFADDAIFG